MTLRQKSILSVGLTALSLVALIALLSQTILLKGYRDLEQELALANIHRAQGVIEDAQTALDTMVSDWANWDDTYEFVIDANESYREANLMTETFSNAKFNLMVIADLKGKPVYTGYYDLEEEQELPIPEGLQKYLSPDSIFFRGDQGPSPTRGILVLDDQPLLIAFRPILTSKSEGPARGVLLMGRVLNSSEIEMMRNTTRLPIEVYLLSQPDLPEDLIKIKSKLIQGQSPLIRILSDERIVEYALIPDLEGLPAVVLRIEEPRAILLEGKRTLSYFLLTILCAGLVFGCVIHLLIGKNVLGPLNRLATSVHSIETRGDLASRVEVRGDDELSALSRGINRMLESLEQSEQRLKESEERYRSIADYMTGWEEWFDPQGRLLWQNLEAREISGYTFEECLAMPDYPAPLIHEEDRERIRTRFQSDVRQAAPQSDLLFRMSRKDGELRWISASWRPLLDSELGYRGLRVSLTDITSKKYAEAALRRSERILSINHRIATIFLTFSDSELYSEVLKVVMEAMQSRYGLYGYIDTAGNLVCPSLTGEIWHQCQVLGKTSVFNPSQWGGIWGRALREKTSFYRNEGLHMPQGHVQLANALAVPILYHEEIVGLFLVADKEEGYAVEDVRLLETIAAQTAPILRARIETERHEIERSQAAAEHLRLQKQLQQSQKMEAIGTLAGGIAHDFNNILSAVLGYAELALEVSRDNTEAEYSVREIIKAGHRARYLVTQILTFSRQNPQERRPLKIQSILKETAKLLRGSIPSTIAIQTEIDETCGPVLADAGQIHQVVMNLCTNAYHAMRPFAASPESSGRLCILSLSLKPAEIDRRKASDLRQLEPGRYVQLSVRDTGMGISPEIKDRIFEPYFTTRPTGEGTGLGLAIVQGIVKAHDGAIEVDSQPGAGSCFYIYFPVCGSLETRERKSERSPWVPGGTEHILLVDDETPILEVGKRTLERYGYIVTTCESGIQAMEAFQADPMKYDVVITDLTMPRMTGMELAQRLLQLRPDLPIILCTGYSESITREAATAAGIRAFLLKPIVARELAAKIRALMQPAEDPGPEGSRT
jgi:PAS domain S-box-containing protein